MIKNTGCRLILVAGALLLGAASLNLAATGGNDFYDVIVESNPAGPGLGVCTFRTGFMHPITASLGAQDVLGGGGIPGTSYTTIRSYTSGTDYVQRNNLTLSAAAPSTLELEGYVAAGDEAIPVGDPLNPSGFTTIYQPGGVAPAPDNLVITQTVQAVGTSFDDSAVMLKTEITNNGSAPVAIGVRYLLDAEIGQGDDGPTFMTKGPDGPVLTADADFLDPNFAGFEMTDNNQSSPCFGIGNYQVPFYSVQGSVQGPAVLKPTPPSRVAYISWPAVSGLPDKYGGLTIAPDAFGFTPTGTDISTCVVTYDDTGVAYWWGDDASNALNIGAGQTVAVAAYLFAYLPSTPPTMPQPGVEGPPGDPTCSDGIDNDGDGLVDMGDPDCIPQPSGVEGPPGDPTCSDGIDNDGDGLIDMNDPDCVATAPATPPSCGNAVASPRKLWPVNHELQPVKITGVMDANGNPAHVTVTSVFQDEPLNTAGDGNSCPDADGLGSDTVMLRAERSGITDGRVYHINFTADDGNGGLCSGEVTVCVPHNRKTRRGCIDQGPIFDSTGSCTTPLTKVRDVNRHRRNRSK